MSHATRGFVLPVVMGIIAIAALFAVHAATELGSTTLFASQRLLHQRAFEAAESGALLVIDELRSAPSAAPDRQVRSFGNTGYAAEVEWTINTRIELPDGFSAGRIVETTYEVRSTGRSARGAEVTVVQGVRQRRAVAAP